MISKEHFVNYLTMVEEFCNNAEQLEGIIGLSAESFIFTHITEMLGWIVEEVETPNDLLPLIMDYCLNHNFGHSEKVFTVYVGDKRKKKLTAKTHEQLYDVLKKVYNLE